MKTRKHQIFLRKSQIQMGETIAVLFVFFILVLLGFMFYTRIAQGNIEVEKEERSQLQAIEIAQRASFLPEVQCSQENIISDNCIDILKLDAASGIIRENEIFYYDKLQFSVISIKSIYPNDAEWVLYNRTLDNFASRKSTNIPIALFDPKVREYSFGVMTVDTFSR